MANPETSGRYHSDWLSMMYPRLKLARNLLAEDGTIFISIDDNEVHNLKKVCDEIFGEINFVGQIIVKSNPRGSQSESKLAGLHDYILAFSRNIFESSIIGHKLTDEMESEYKFIENNKAYRLLGLRQRGGFWRRSERPNLFFPIYLNPLNGEVSLEFGEEFNMSVLPFQPTTGEEGTWRWGKEKIRDFKTELIAKAVKRNGEEVWDIFQKDFLDRGEERRTKAKSIWDEKSINYQNGTIEVKELLNSGIFDFPKPTFLVERILEMLSKDNNDIILDFYSGSGTTANAVLKINISDGGKRKFIMVQIPETTDPRSEAYKAGYHNICDIGKERIRQASKKIKENLKSDIEDNKAELQKLETGQQSIDLAEKKETLQQEIQELEAKLQNTDFGFRVYRLDESNMQDVYYRPQDFTKDLLELTVDNIKPDRTPDDLLAQIMLDWGLPLSLKISSKDVLGKQVFSVADDSLYACFDNGIDEAFIKEIAKDKPLRIVFKDSGFTDDTAKVNVKQLLKQLSPETEMKVI